MTVRICENIEELSQFFAQKLNEGLKNLPPGVSYSIGLPGGSTPRLVFKYLADNFRDRADWQKIRVFWGDERCVKPDSDDSNYRMAMTGLLDHVPVPAENIFRIRGEDEPAKEAMRYAEVVKKNIRLTDGIPELDLLILGLGEDGHTASIFPGSLHLFSSDRLFEVAEHPVSKQKRITATGKIINHAKAVIFIVTGESKAEMVARIIEKKEVWEQLPASLVRPVSGELTWLLDEAAAMKLSVY